MKFVKKLELCAEKNNSLVCVGLDSDVEKLPHHILDKEYPQFEFNREIVRATADLVCAYKPNMAFYEARGEVGMVELKMTMDYLQYNHPEIPVICDAKRADIGNTNKGYTSAIFDHFGFDGVTLHPYLGKEALVPFLQYEDRGIVLLCRTSNPGSGELQETKVRVDDKEMIELFEQKLSEGEDFEVVEVDENRWVMVELYLYLAARVVLGWNEHENCMLVVGATYPEEMRVLRKLVGELTFLVPGVGAQGRDVEKVVRLGVNKNGAGLMINSSRGVIFAGSGEDFGEQAREVAGRLRDEINECRSLI